GPERIAVAIDAQGGRVCTHGWRETTEYTSVELAQWCAEHGVRWVVHTDISRDGTEKGLDLAPALHLAADCRLRVVVGGGLASIEDVARARAAGLAGVIIGRALYEGRIDLREALAVGG
ncbi:MAG: HisA/HisF-related TIM barrel protein, partial [Chloroflexia bacterium]